MLKKLSLMLTLIMCLCSFTPISAQEQTQKVHLFDNVYVGASGGLVDPVGFNGLTPSRWNFGIELGKDISPVVGLSVECLGNVNTTPSKTAFDQSLLMANVKFNMMNLICGYKGKPRTFEIVAYPSVGWRYGYGHVGDRNECNFRLGADWNFNLGHTKAWTLGAKTGLIYPHNMRWHGTAFDARLHLTYHFKNSDYRHYYVLKRGSNFTDDDYYTVVAEKDAAMQKFKTAKEALENCKGSTDTVIVVRRDVHDELKSLIIPFDLNSTYIGFNPMLEKIANDVIDTKKKLRVTGYASVEGTPERNKALSLERAEAIRDYLIELGVDAKNIEIKGAGSTEEFGYDYEHNRVVVVEKL